MTEKCDHCGNPVEAILGYDSWRHVNDEPPTDAVWCDGERVTVAGHVRPVSAPTLGTEQFALYIYLDEKHHGTAQVGPFAKPQEAAMLARARNEIPGWAVGPYSPESLGLLLTPAEYRRTAKR